jgi:long-subunit acyl-CoA synthetase (AMP-forming)
MALAPVTLHATLCEAFQATAERFVGDVALRTPGGEVEWTWGEYRERVESVARGLARLGVGRGDTVALLMVNRPEFHVLDTAALHLGATPFSVYATSTAEQMVHVLGNAGNRVVVCEPAFLERVLAARERLPALEHVVVVGGEAPGTMALAELAAAPAPGGRFERTWRDVGPDDVATLIYTSGTTGPPKGVMLTHANLLAAWDASVAAVPVLGERGRYVSYLPTAHLADRVFSHYPAMVNGSAITCVEDPRAAVGLLGAIRPTVWLAVPRIWEKLKDAIEAMLDGRPITPAVATTVRERLGLGEVELLVSGSAPIRTDVLEFFSGLGLPICEGYGMTECSAVATLNLPGEQRLGTVGRPVPGVDIALAGDGEVLIRSAGVMVGYRGQPEATAAAVDAGGWLHTGDVGTLDADGFLSIVDRKKELIINAAGKNMSPANIEARLKAASPLIGHAVAIGDRRPYNTALLVCDPDALALHAHRHGAETLSPGDERVRDAIAAAVDEANTHLSRVEQIKRWVVLDDDWPAGGELVTETLKLRRRPIAERYADVIDALYDD